VNLTNVFIVGLLVLGGWLLLSALLSVRPRKATSPPDAVFAAEPAVAEAQVTEPQVAGAPVTEAPEV
jgi:hypothetical protein